MKQERPNSSRKSKSRTAKSADAPPPQGKALNPAVPGELDALNQAPMASKTSRPILRRPMAAQEPADSPNVGLPAWNTFAPRLDILPPEQQALWPHLRETARMGFVLYGGTAIALRLGHRPSVDFDFFTERPFDHQQLIRRLPFLAQATVIQDEPDTLTYSLDPSAPGRVPVKVSFFTVGTGRLWDPERTQDGVLLAASMPDLLAHKLKVLMQRVEIKDYLDVHGMVTQGFRLEAGLAGARAMFGRSFQPAQALKALTWFKDGNLHELPKKVQSDLIAAVAKVGDLPSIPTIQHTLGGGMA